MNVAICDDDEVFASELEANINLYGIRYFKKIDIEIYSSAEELYFHMENNGKKHIYNLIFLDIEMKGMNGIEIGRIIRNKLNNEAVQIIYVSSHVNYALQLFAIQPLAFITKPVSLDKLFEALALYFSKAVSIMDVFHFQFNKLNYIIKYKNIIYFETAYDKKIKLIHKDGEYIFYDTIDHIYEKLKDSFFYKVHRGCIINIQYVKYIEGHIIKMADEHQVFIPQRKQKTLQDFLKEIGGKFNE